MLEYDETYWHKRGRDANCYLYAMNARYPENSIPLREQFKRTAAEVATSQMPGCLSGHTSFPGSRNFVKYIGKDGGSYVEHHPQVMPSAPNGHYLIIAFKGERDTHFLRQDDDGTWSHKHGHSEISRFDDQGNIITNPLRANLDRSVGISKSFTGFFAIPAPGWTEAYPAWLQRETLQDMHKRFSSKIPVHI